MAEEPVISPPIEPPVEPPAAPVVYVNPDGTFIDDWQKNLADETLHEDETLRTIKNVDSLAKSYVHVRKQVPMDKVVIPTETSPPEVRDEFHKAGGRPDVYTPPEIPDELKDYYEQEMVTEATAELHKAGLSQKQYDVVMALDRKRLEFGMKQLAETEERERSEAETALMNKWGTAYAERLHLANRMVSENAAAGEQREKILGRIGNDPLVADFLANIAGKFKEHGIITDVETPSADLQGRIKELMDSPAYKDPKFPDRKEHARVVSEVYSLREQLSKMGVK